MELKFKNKKDFAYKMFDALVTKIEGGEKNANTLTFNNIQIKLINTRNDRGFRLHLYIGTDKKWIFTLKKVHIMNNKITCILNSPDNELNKICYEYFGITKKNQYTLCKKLGFDCFLDMYIKLMNDIVSIHNDFNKFIKNKLKKIDDDEFRFKFINGKIPNCKYSRERIRKITKKYSNIHGEIQKKIVNFYENKGWNVAAETFDDDRVNVRIDVVVSNKKEVIFFEVKPYLISRQCIRESFGQLLEYSMYYSEGKMKASQLVVVGPNKAERKDGEYLEKIRTKYKIPIKYVSVNQLDIL